jgi:AcrR family transcriptional regulator
MPAQVSGDDRPLRADAARNRDRILEAAQQLFAEAGLDAGVEEIARRAGVGKGTLYRRFPTKDELIAAIFDSFLANVERHATDAEAVADPWEAYVGFVTTLARAQADNQGFIDVVARSRGTVFSADKRRRFIEHLRRPLARAQAAGVVREDLEPQDLVFVLRMLGAASRPAPDGSPMGEAWLRYLGLMLDGMRPDAATAFPAPAWQPA